MIIINTIPCFDKGKCDYSSRILDIGCGVGTLLIRLKEFGFSDLIGIDPFISADIIYPNGVKIWKRIYMVVLANNMIVSCYIIRLNI